MRWFQARYDIIVIEDTYIINQYGVEGIQSLTFFYRRLGVGAGLEFCGVSIGRCGSCDLIASPCAGLGG